MKIVDYIDLEDGIYYGVWGGFTLTIKNKTYKTLNGIKCTNCKVKILVEENKAFKIE